VHTFGSWLEHTIHPEEAAHAAEAVGEAVAEAGGFNPVVAVVSTVLALLALFISWLLYDRRYKALLQLPPARRPDDPLRGMLGPVNPYIALARFLAEVVDWRFWHDWFHDVVITAGFRLLTSLLAVRVDLGGIDAVANGLADLTKGLAARLRRLQTGYVRNYALSVFIGVVVILGYLIFR